MPASKGFSSRNKWRNRRESTRTGRKKPGLQAIHRVPSGENSPPGTTSAGGDGAADFGPGVQDGEEADPGAEMPGVGGGVAEEQPVDERLVLVGDGGNGLRQREDDMKVLCIEQFGAAIL